MSGFQTFSWRGKPIRDIEAWAKERGERMVHYKGTRMVPSPWCAWELIEEVDEGSMPESFWDGLCMRDGWTYKEIK